MTARPRPSLLWFFVPAAAFVALVVHLVLAVVATFGALRDMPRGAMPGAVPGAMTVELAAGRALVFYESEDGIASPRLRCTLTAAGAEVALTPYTGSLKYEIGPLAGNAVLAADIAAGGPHVLACSQPGPAFVMAVGGDPLASVGRTSAIGIGLLLLMLASAGVTLFRFFRARGGRSRGGEPGVGDGRVR